MKDFLNTIVVDESPYTHPMLTPVTAFGWPTDAPDTKTGPVGGECQEPERAEDQVVKEQRVAMSGFLGFPVIVNNSTK